MTADEFRELALSFAHTTESAHMGHPDFRAHGKIFATLAYPDATFGMVKLAPHDQAHMVERYPHAFVPVKGAWGVQGCTNVRLSNATPDILAPALELAWQNSAHGLKTKPKKISKRIGNEKSV
jgi:hypothetical protein